MHALQAVRVVELGGHYRGDAQGDQVATVLGDAGISIDRMRQYGQHSDSSVPVLVVTHKTTPEAIDYAIEALPRTGVLVSDPVELRIEEV